MKKITTIALTEEEELTCSFLQDQVGLKNRTELFTKVVQLLATARKPVELRKFKISLLNLELEKLREQMREMFKKEKEIVEKIELELKGDLNGEVSVLDK